MTSSGVYWESHSVCKTGTHCLPAWVGNDGPNAEDKFCVLHNLTSTGTLTLTLTEGFIYPQGHEKDSQSPSAGEGHVTTHNAVAWCHSALVSPESQNTAGDPPNLTPHVCPTLCSQGKCRSLHTLIPVVTCSSLMTATNTLKMKTLPSISGFNGSLSILCSSEFQNYCHKTATTK